MNSRSHNWHKQPICATGTMDLMSDLSLLGIDDKTLDELIEFKEPGKRPLSPPINELFQREVICDKRKEKQQLTEEPPAKRFRMEPNVNRLPPPAKTHGISVTKDDERLLVDLFMYGCGLVAVGYENRPSFTHDIMNPGNPGIVTFEKRYNTMCVPFRDTRAYPGIELAAGIWNDVKLSSFEELNPSLGISSVKFDSSVSHIDDLLVKHGRNFGGTYPLYTEIDSKISQLFVNREWLVVGNRVRTPEQNRGSHIFTPISDVDLEQIHGPLSAKLSVPDPMCLLNMLEQSTVLGSPDPFRLCLVLGSTTVMENLARYARRSEADLPSDYQDYSARILKLLDSLNVRYSKCSEEQQDLRCFLNLHSSKSTFNHIYWIAPDDARRVLLRIISGLIERNFSLPRSQCCPRMAFDLHLVPGTCELYTENLNTILHLAQNGPNWKLLSEDVNRFCDRIHRGDSELDVLIFRLSCIFSTRKCISEQGVPIIDGIPLSGAVLETLSSLKSGTRPQLESMLSMYHQIQTINQRLASQIGKMSSSAEELTKLQERASSDSNATQTRWEESANNMAQSINNQITTSVELLRQFITAIPINVSHHLTGMAPLPGTSLNIKLDQICDQVN